MAAALNGRGFGKNGAGAPPSDLRPQAAARDRRDQKGSGRVPATHNIVTFPALGADDVDLGIADTGGPIGLDLAKLIDGRLLIQGASGAGKSWTLRRLLEQTAGRVQQIVIDPEGEFRGLAAHFELLHLEAHLLDIATLSTAGGRAREHRASIVLDLSQLERDDQMKSLTAFVTALVAAPREHWHPAIVAVDEAHLFAPFGGYNESTSVRKASIAALTDLMSRGRKRGLAGILATQRLARLAKSVASEAHNVMVGLNVLDIDIRRAAEAIGWDASKGFDRLPMLSPGEFVAVGPAFSRSPVVTKVGAVETPHGGATPRLKPPTAINAHAAAKALDLEALLAASASDRGTLEERSEPSGLRAIRHFIRHAAFPDAGRVYGALLKLVPDGAKVTDLAKHLNRKPEEIAAALALLDQYGVLEFSGDGEDRAARLAKGMRP